MKYRNAVIAVFFNIFTTTNETQSMDILKEGLNIGKLFVQSLVFETPNPNDSLHPIQPALPIQRIVNDALSLSPFCIASHIFNQIRHNPIDTFSTAILLLSNQGVVDDSSFLNLVSFGLTTVKRFSNLAEFFCKITPLRHASIVDQKTKEVLENIELPSDKISTLDLLQAATDICIIYQGIEFLSRMPDDQICGESKELNWKGCYPSQAIEESISKFSNMKVLPGNQCSKEYLFEGTTTSHSLSLEESYQKLLSIPQDKMEILSEIQSLNKECLGIFCPIDTQNKIGILSQKFVILDAEKKHLAYNMIHEWINNGRLAEAHHALINSYTLNSEGAFAPNFVDITGIKTLHEKKFTGQNSTVLVLDTPLDPQSTLYPHQIELLSTEAIYTKEADIHATHVVGIIQQMAPNAIIKADIVEHALSSKSSVRKVYDMTEIDAVNISMDLPFLDESREKIIELAYVIKEWIKKDTAIFLAFGNDGNTESKKFYEKYYKLLSNFTTNQFFQNRIIVVGNLDYYQSFNEFPIKESSSNFCEKTQPNVIFAPGTNICSTLPNNRVGLNTGTSMATPVVSGAFTTLRSLFSRKHHSNHAIADLMMRSADKNIKTSSQEIHQYGVGVLNIENAINLARSEGWIFLDL